MSAIKVLNVDAPDYDAFVPDETPNSGYLHFLEGEPGGVQWLETRDPNEATEGPTRLLLSGLYWADPCKFTFTFPGDETIHVLEGDLTIELETGQVLELHRGDVVWFPKGMRSTWTVHTYFREFFTVFG